MGRRFYSIESLQTGCDVVTGCDSAESPEITKPYLSQPVVTTSAPSQPVVTTWPGGAQ